MRKYTSLNIKFSPKKQIEENKNISCLIDNRSLTKIRYNLNGKEKSYNSFKTKSPSNCSGSNQSLEAAAAADRKEPGKQHF